MTQTADAIERRKAERQKRLGAKYDGENDNPLRAKWTEELQLAFDEKHARSFSHVHDKYLEVSVFDGAQTVRYTKYFTHEQEQYELSRSPKQFFQFFFGNLSWPRAGAHSFWFLHDKLAATRARITGYAKDYTFVGEADFRGRRCYVLENRLAGRRMHVGIDDRRLHGLTMYVLPRDVDLLPAIQRAAGRTFANETEADAWLETLSVAGRDQYNTRLKAEKFALMRVRSEFFLDDYRKIAPGFWFPGEQTVPELPKSTWLNSPSLNLESLKGNSPRSEKSRRAR